jgi:hypothetical protein
MPGQGKELTMGILNEMDAVDALVLGGVATGLFIGGVYVATSISAEYTDAACEESVVKAGETIADILKLDDEVSEELEEALRDNFDDDFRKDVLKSMKSKKDDDEDDDDKKSKKSKKKKKRGKKKKKAKKSDDNKADDNNNEKKDGEQKKAA